MSKASDTEKAQANFDAFSRAHDGRHERFLKDAEKHDRFYLGDQWEEDLRRKLEGEGRPVLTINEVLSTTNAILGEHGNQRVDIRFKPRQHADEETAMVMTHVMDHILDMNRYGDVEAQVFADGLITDVGYFDVRIDFDRNVLGEVEIRSLDPHSVVIDRDAKEYDPDTWTEVFVTRWHTLDEIEATYGKKKANEIKGLLMAGTTLGQNSVRFNRDPRFGDDTAHPVPTGTDALKQLRGIRVIERQWKKLTRRQVFVDLESGDTRAVPTTWDDERVMEVAQRYGLGVHTMVVPRVRWTVSCDHVLLHDDWSLYEQFTVVPYFPFFRRGRFSGLVRQLISPQEQLNKIESQQLHVVNTTANSGWVVEEGALANMTPEELEERGAETGLVIVNRRGREAPQKIQPNQVPTGLDRLGGKALDFIYSISGAEALLGQPPKSTVSGVAMERSESRALVRLQVIFDHLAKSRYMVAKRVLKLVQQFYNETRVLRVTDWRHPEEEDVEVAINQVTPSGEILNNITIGKYDLIVGTAPARDGALETEFAEAIQLMEVGVPIPPEVIIRASHLANKHEVAEEVKRMEGRGDPSDEEAQMIQMQQEMEMQAMQLQLQELQAKTQKLAAEAMQYEAKAQSTMAEAELTPQIKQAELQLEFEKLQFQIAKAEADLQNKLELARTHTQARNAQTIMSTMAKRMETERKLRSQEKIAALSRVTQPRQR